MKRNKKIIISVCVTLVLVLAAAGLFTVIYRKNIIQKIKDFPQETNEDGIVVDMSGNPYYNKKQLGYSYPNPKTIKYYSDITGTYRHAMVFLPAGYDEDKEYPVLYLLHGLDGSHRTWKNKSADIILQNLYYFADVPEMIVVCPNSAVNEEENTDGLSITEKIGAYDLTAKDLVENLMPYINSHYSVKTGRENTAIAGNSMGGRNTMYAAFTYPELFGYVGVFSAANVLTDERYAGVMYPLLDELKVTEDFNLIMLCVGRSDNVCGEVTYRLHDALNEAGIEHIFYDTEGGHQNTVWQNALYNFTKKLWK